MPRRKLSTALACQNLRNRRNELFVLEQGKRFFTTTIKTLFPHLLHSNLKLESDLLILQDHHGLSWGGSPVRALGLPLPALPSQPRAAKPELFTGYDFRAFPPAMSCMKTNPLPGHLKPVCCSAKRTHLKEDSAGSFFMT